MVSPAELLDTGGPLQQADNAPRAGPEVQVRPRPDAAPTHPPGSPVSGARSSEVEISGEARARSQAEPAAKRAELAQARRAAAAESRRSEIAEASRPEIQFAEGSRSTIVARLGPGPAPVLADPEQAALAELEQRAALRQVASVVLASPEPAARVIVDAPSAPAAQVVLPGEGARSDEIRLPGTRVDGAEGGELPLFGSGRTGGEEIELLGRDGDVPGERPALPRSDGGAARLVSMPQTRHAAAPNPAPVQHAPTPHRSEAVERQALERPVTSEDLQLASAAAPHAAPAQSAERVNTTDRGSESEVPAPLPGEAIAERTLTQAGAVEARFEDELVTRYFERTKPEDAGPEPRVREELRQNVP